jgi:dTDP-4-amino-4,6-dideoxygalactose transaminase
VLRSDTKIRLTRDASSLEEAETAVPFNDLAIQWHEIQDDVRKDFDDVFVHSAFCLGPHVDAFEREVADFLGATHAVAVNSGTSALHLAAIAAGLGSDDEVLVPAHTFIATLWGPLYVGARPVLCDVDDATGTIDPTDAERRITSRTRAILPVHLYGQPADMDALARFAKRHRLILIEDAAQAIGARWNGRSVGTLGVAGCFSFYPGKNLGAAGEGGLVVTNDPTVDARLRLLRHHGQRERYVHEYIGFNYRMDALQAAVLRQKLRRLDGWTARRRILAQRYQRALTGLPLRVPQVCHQDHVWHLFVIRTKRRDSLRAYLRAAGIETGLHYPVAIHRQPCLAHLVADRDSYPNAEEWARECLSLPLFYGMTDDQVDQVVQRINDFFAR